MNENENRMATPKDGSGRRTVRILIAMTLALFLPALALMTALHFPFIQKKGITRIAGQVERRTGYSLHMASYRMWPFFPFLLTDLQVLASGKEVLHCARAFIKYRLSTRWPYTVPVEIELYKPTLYLEKDPVEGWRIPVPEKRPSGSPRGEFLHDRSHCTEFPLPRLRVEAGTILGEQSGQQVMVLRDVNGTLTMKVDCSSGSPRITMDLQQWQPDMGPDS